MLVCVAGKNNIAVDILEYLEKNNAGRYELGILCNKNETGENGWQKSLRFMAKRKLIREYDLEELYDIESLIFLSLEYDRIVKPELFKSKQLYNIHFSLLPKYKGMYTSALSILNGERKIGVTLHKIDRGIDTGDIIAQQEFELLDSYTCRDVYQQFIKQGTQLVLNNIENVLSGKIVARPQASQNSTYYSKAYIDYDNLKIDLNQTAEGIQRQIRAFSFREYQMPKVYDCPIIESYITNIKSCNKPGDILCEDERSILLSTIDYNIVLYKDRFCELVDSCRIGDIEKVIDICVVKKHINEIESHGWSPLIIATYNNHVDIVLYLISVGADLYVTNNNGTTLLMYAKEAYLRTGDISLIEIYRKLGLPVIQKDYFGKDLFYYIENSCCSDEQKEELYRYLK